MHFSATVIYSDLQIVPDEMHGTINLWTTSCVFQEKGVHFAKIPKNWILLYIQMKNKYRC